MKTHWSQSEIVSAAPIALFLLLFVCYGASLELFTSCGGRLAGCAGLGGDKVQQLARRDERPVLREAFASVRQHGVEHPDTALERLRKVKDAKRQSALKVVVTRFDRRLIWSFFSGLSAMLAVVSVVAAALLARASPSLGRVGARGRVLLVMSCAAISLVGLTFAARAQMPTIHPLLMASVKLDADLGMPAVPSVMGFLNALSNAAGIALGISVWLLIRPWPADKRAAVPAANKAELMTRLDGLRKASRYLQMFLYVGTAALVIGVLRTNATFTWLQSFLVPADEASLDALRVTLISMIGAFYSLSLASLYLPAAYILRERASVIVGRARVSDEEKAQVGEADFSAGLKDVFPRVVALLGPVLAGPIGELVKALSG